MFFHVPLSLCGVYVMPQMGRRGPELNVNGQIADPLARYIPVQVFLPVVGSERRTTQQLFIFTR